MLEVYEETHVFIPGNITKDMVNSVTRKLSGDAEPVSMDLEALQGWLLNFGDHRKNFVLVWNILWNGLTLGSHPGPPIRHLCLTTCLYCISYPYYVWWALGKPGSNFLLSVY